MRDVQPLVLLLNVAQGVPVLSDESCENVFYVDGSPLDVEDLRRAGAETAAVCLIMANPPASTGQGASAPSSGVADVSNVFCVRAFLLNAFSITHARSRYNYFASLPARLCD